MIKWTPKSQEDLVLIMEHIASNFNVDLAVVTIERIIDYTKKTLTNNPLAGSILESNPFFSKLIFEGNSIFYCENPKNKHLYIVYVRPRRTDLNPERINHDEVA